MKYNLLSRIASARSFIFAMASFASLALSAFDTPYLTFRSATSFSISATKRWDGTIQKATSNPANEASWSEWTGSLITAVETDGQYYIYLRGSNNTIINGSNYTGWSLSGSNVYCEGDIETLRGYDGNVPAMGDSCYQYLFYGCTALKSIPTLSAATATEYCYYTMFGGCTGLEVNTTGPGVEWTIPSSVGRGVGIWNYDVFKGTSGSFTGNPVAGTTYYVASALPFGEMYQVGGSGTLDIAYEGLSYNVDLTSTIKNGATPYTFSFAGGTPPPGLQVSGSTLSGTPTAAGSYNFTLSVTDSESHTLASAAYSLRVAQPQFVPTSYIGGNTNCIRMTTDMTTLNQEWYVVDSTLNFGTGGIKVSGNVNIVLADGASLTVQGASKKAGINVAYGNSLTIYAQSLGETAGSLTASGYASDGFNYGGAGIGGNDSENCGTITINGGIITATGAQYTSAAIGGGMNGNGGTVTINGGTVTATGGSWYGAGIGGGKSGNGGAVTINGGTVTAIGGSSNAGRESGSNGIGKGYGYGFTAGTLTVAETISVKAGDSENPTTELTRDAVTGAITIGTQRYFTAESTGPVPLAQTTSQFAAYTRESKNWNLAETVSGGTTPYTFALASGSSLPSGLNLSGANNATLSGSVATPDTYNFTLTVTDAASPDPQVQNFAYTLVVSAPAALSAQSDLGEIKQGKAANFNLSSTITGGVPVMDNGSPVYTFAPVDIKTGFALNNGVLSVASSVAAGEYTNVVSVTDSLGTTLPSVSYTLTVVEAAGYIADDPEEPESGVSVDCLTEDGVVRKRMCNTVTSSASAVVWEDSWYYVTGNVSLSAGATVNGKVSLVLADGATLTVSAARNTAGITVAAGNTLTIYAQSAGASVGKLIATGGDSAAGIGGGNRTTCGKVNIYGGEITATGTGFGAGIGGGGSGNGGTVTVNGGKVVASGGNQLAPGIGTVNGDSHGTLTVAEDVIVKAGSSANPTDELNPVAPGGNQYFVVEKYVLQPLVQTGNTLVAYLNEATDLTTLLAGTVSGGETPYSFAFKSGTLPGGISSATLTGTPTAEGGPYAFTVTVTDDAAQEEDFTYSITVVERIEGKEQVTFPGEDGNPRTEWCTPITSEVEGKYTVLGSGWYVVSENVMLTKHSLVVDGDVKLVLGSGKTLTVSGIGNYVGERLAGLCVTNDNVLSIYGTGSLVASGTYWTPGIGGDGYGAACGTVKIYGGNITSTGNDNAAGIGGGSDGSGGTVEIYGGTVTATGGSSGAGIGGGSDGAGGTIDIYGGTVTATGGDYAAGIGGGSGADGGTVTIHGGTITATGGQMGGSGIGGGNNGDGANVTIYGGTVTATGNDSYKPTGIGGSYYASSDGTLTTTPNVTVKAGNSPSPTEVLVRNASTGEITLQRFKYYTVESETVSGLQLISSALSAYAGKTPTWNLASTISGGTPPYSFALSESSSLPSGLSVSSAGVPSGSAGAGTYNFTFNVTDSAGAEPLAASYTLTVNPFTALAAVSGAGTLGTVAKNGSVNIDFSAKVSGGVQPYSFAVASGSDLPNGLSLNAATGALTGAPTAVGEYAFTITVTDSDSPADSVNIACTLSVKERYTITYYESDGRTKVSGTMPIFYFGGEGAVLGSPFAKTGYIFAGWYANQDLETGGVVTEISASDSGNKVFYAKWTEKSSKMPVSFIGADGSLQEESCTVITSDMSELASGWYVVPENVTMDGSLYINGNVSIVLLDNVNLLSVDRLNDKAGICVTNGNSLTVYGQSKANTGRLIATGTTGAAGIGGVRGQDCGTVTIYGGTVEATGGTGAAGIGGGYNGNGGTVSIYGGTVTATGKGSDYIDGGAGIGGGAFGIGGTVAIYGGTVTATGHSNGTSVSPGIGGKGTSYHGSLTVAADIIVKAGASANPTAEKTRNLETGAITLNGEQYYTAAKGAVQYSITYMNGDTPLDLAPATYTYGKGLAELPEPGTAPAGFSFAGWYTDSLFSGDPVTSIASDASGDVTLYAKWAVRTEKYMYIDGSGSHTVMCTAITNGTAELSTGWYIVTDSLTLGNSVTINGAVNLVLKDGKTLTVNGSNNTAGIAVIGANSLTIYGESLGTGELVVTGGGNGAGIGGNTAFGQSSAANGTCGAVTINGGIVTATGGNGGAGIGGGNDGSGGTVVVNGGTVTATGGGAAASGIGYGLPGTHYASLTHGTLYVDAKLSVKAGSSPNPTENAIRDGLNYVTLSRQQYFTITPPAVYNIAYYIDGALANLAPAKYTEGVGATLPSGLERDGYEFDGWYANSGYTGSKVTRVLASETGDRTFYAKWDKAAVPLSQTTTALPEATIDVSYNTDLNDTVTGGTGPYTFALKSGSSLPGTLALTSGGLLSGTVDVADTYTFKIDVTDAASTSIVAEYTLVAGSDPADPAPSQTASVPSPAYARMNALYTGSLASTVSGGEGPYTFELASYSYLPSGIQLASDGTLSGMVTGGGSTFSVIVTNGNGKKAKLTYTLDVAGVSASSEYDEGKERTWTYVTYGDGAGGIGGVAIYNDDECALEFVIPTTYDVAIPSKIDGVAVKCIGDWSFYDRAELTGLAIPDGVTSIGICAFYGCENLKSLTIPDSVTYIGEYAFEDCALDTVCVAHGKTEYVSNLLAAAGCDLTGTEFFEASVVTFDENYGSGSTTTRQVVYGSEVGELPVPTRPRATFDGWFTEATGGTQVDEHEVITADVTFYAHWTVDKVTVTFLKNDGSDDVVEIRQVNYGEAVGTLPTPTREHYDLAGWYRSDSGSGVPYQATTVITADITLYAHWTTAQYTVTFEFNDGTGGTRTRRITHGSAVGTLPNDIARENYELVGWFTAADGGDEVSASTVITGPVSFYAHWTEDSASDWPADTSTVAGQTAAEAFDVTGDLAGVDAKDLADWAKANSVDFGNKGTIIANAFLLNCANTAEAVATATATAKEAIKITKIEIVDGVPTLTCPENYGNGRVVIKGSVSIGASAEWHDKTTGDKFFKTVLELK